MRYRFYYLVFFWVWVQALYAQNAELAVEVGAFAERVSLQYFRKLSGVYETVDQNQIYRYYIDAPDRATADRLRQEAITAGHVHARVIDFAYLREVCSSQCGYIPPSSTGQRQMPSDPDRQRIAIATPKGGAPAPNAKRAPQSALNPAAATTAPDPAAGDSFEDDLMRIEWLFFDFDRYFLRPKSNEELDKAAYILRKYPAYTIELRAHTDGKGSLPYNERLSQNRAKSARQYLIKKGIPAKRIRVQTFGKLSPIAKNEINGSDTEQGRQFNRRVEIKILDGNSAEVPIVDVIQIPAELRE